MIFLPRSSSISPVFQNASALTTATVMLLIVLKITLWLKGKQEHPTKPSEKFQILFSGKLKRMKLFKIKLYFFNATDSKSTLQ